MKSRGIAAAALLLLGALVALPPGSAQQEELFALDLQAEETLAMIEPQGAVVFYLTVVDYSRDSTQGLAGDGVPNVSPRSHRITFDYEFLGSDTGGWAINAPNPIQTKGGDSREVKTIVTASQLATNPYLPFRITATMRGAGQEFNSSVDFLVVNPGLEGFNLQVSDGMEIGQGETVEVPVRITNGGLFPRGFDITITSNPCGLTAAASTNNLVGPKETKTYTVSIRGPEDRLWYFAEVCSLGLEVAPTGNPIATRATTMFVTVNGGYIDPVWVMNIFWILLAVLILLLFLKRRKERLEEEILGKPQKPWTIPVEVVYLSHLKAKDERAWYVVRHHLMEEEYASSLLWYKAYKKATKGTRSKERLVVKQERDYAKWTAAWKKDIAKPLAQADKYEVKLQKKLDRKARKAHKKEMRKYTNLTSKMRAAHLKQEERALEKWAKEARRAAKKGLAEPAKPKLPAPDYPAEPVLQARPLAGSRYAKRADRYRARMVRKQGNLEVRFEKADARRHAKLERKIRRIARKLDDPQFIEEHPLLADKPGAHS